MAETPGCHAVPVGSATERRQEGVVTRPWSQCPFRITSGGPKRASTCVLFLEGGLAPAFHAVVDGERGAEASN